jgi:DNA (cytosine-5)-methyltransferase 1
MKPLRFGTFCSGIGAPECAWRGLGWQPAWCSEIDPFASAVLAHHFPNVPNHGDMTKLQGGDLERVDLVCAGTPCQSFSVAGQRGGMDDPRGNLALRFSEHVGVIRPKQLVWENVPGILSSWTDETTYAPSEGSLAVVGEIERIRKTLEVDGIDVGPKISSRDFEEVDQTNDFDQFTFALLERGHSLAWGILDAQYFGVPQRRRRVFVVGSLGNWTDPAAILFDRACLSGHPAPSRETGQGIAASLTHGADGGCNGGYAGRRREDDTNLIAAPLRAVGPGSARVGDSRGQDALVAGTLSWNGKAAESATQQDAESNLLIAHTLSADGFDASEDGTGRGTPIIPILEVGKGTTSRGAGPNGAGIGNANDPMFTLQAGAQHAIAFQSRASSCQSMNPNEIAPSLDVGKSGGLAVAFQTRIARNGRGQPKEIADALTSCEGGTHADSKPHVAVASGVRRLTPLECERLQGLPDGWTDIIYCGKHAKDSPRYRAIGNSMAVPVLRWIAQHIRSVDEIAGNLP